MKDAVVRARIDAELKAQAGEVLKANALDMSDAIRIFLQQVVRCHGLPFHVRSSRAGIASARALREMKSASQARDRKLVESGVVSPEAMMLLRPERLEGMEFEWPDADTLLDD